MLTLSLPDSMISLCILVYTTIGDHSKMKISSPWLCIKGCWKQKTDELTMSENDKGTIQDEGNSLLQVFATISSE